MKRVCVFCGSSSGNRKDYATAAERLAEVLVREKIELVYGGGGTGIMGTLSKTVMRLGGAVTGVIPQGLATRELANRDITDLRIVKTMHERKKLMFDLSDAFIALPGGVGTLEEFAEMITWSQLGIHRKPCGLLNTAGYYDPLVSFFDTARSEGFLREEYRALVLIDEEPAALLEKVRNWRSSLTKTFWTSQGVD